jgi:predicted transcriptional regulator
MATALGRTRVLISLKPEFAALIYCGSKKVEFRRGRMRVVPGQPVLIYETRPIAAVTGGFTIGRVLIGDPLSVAANEQDEAMRQRIVEYLKGATIATALEIENSYRLASPAALDVVTTLKRAPQSYAFIR